jgi:tRNA(His) 5'-end guanylyltransferase
LQITLVFAPVDLESKQAQTPQFSGRVQKISTLLAGFASTRFNHYLINSTFTKEEAKLKEKAFGGNAYFDCRLFATPTKEDAMVRCDFANNRPLNVL